MGINYSVSRLYQSLESVISNLNVISESVLSRDLVLFPYYGTRGVFYHDDKLFIQEGSNFRFRLEMNQRERVHINDIQANLEFSGARFDLLNYATINNNQVIINRDYNSGFNQIVELDINPPTVFGNNFFGSNHPAHLSLYVDGSIERHREMRPFNPIRLDIDVVPVKNVEFLRMFNLLVDRLGPLSRFPWAIIKPLFIL